MEVYSWCLLKHIHELYKYYSAARVYNCELITSGCSSTILPFNNLGIVASYYSMLGGGGGGGGGGGDTHTHPSPADQQRLKPLLQ